jgi:hypothetical protein
MVFKVRADNRQLELGIIKPTIYSHCHILDFYNNMISFDYYSCTTHDHPYINKDKVTTILSKHSANRLTESLDGNFVNTIEFLENSLKKWVLWGNYSLKNLDIKL